MLTESGRVAFVNQNVVFGVSMHYTGFAAKRVSGLYCILPKLLFKKFELNIISLLNNVVV